MTRISSLVDNSRTTSDKRGVRMTSSMVISGLSNADSAVQLDNAILEGGFVLGDQHPIFPEYTLINIDGKSIGTTEVTDLIQHAPVCDIGARRCVVQIPAHR